MFSDDQLPLITRNQEHVVDYETPRFESSRVAAACGIPASTFRGHFRRKNFRMLGEMNAKAADIDGLPNLFSLRDAMGLAVAVALMKEGVEPKPAFQLGVVRFANTGCSQRLPGRLFDERELGLTAFIVHQNAEDSKIIHFESSIDFDDLFIGRQSGARQPALVLILNDIERQVFSILRPQETAVPAHVQRALERA